MIDTNEMYLRNSSTVSLIGTANDVIHSIYIPRLGFKIDLIPGRLSTTSLSGTFSLVNYGVCAEICGANHAFIPFKYSFVS